MDKYVDKVYKRPYEEIYEIIFTHLLEMGRTKITKDAYESAIDLMWLTVHNCIELSVRHDISEQVKDYEF